MTDSKGRFSQLFPVLLAVAIIMIVVFYQYGQSKSDALASRDDKIASLNQAIVKLEQELGQTQDAISGLKGASQAKVEELKSAREIVGELETLRQKNKKEVSELKNALAEKENQISTLTSQLAEVKNDTIAELAAKERLLAEANETIRRLEESQKALQEKQPATNQ